MSMCSSLEIDDDFLRELAERLVPLVIEALKAREPVEPESAATDDDELARKASLVLNMATRHLKLGQKFFSPEQVREHLGWSKNEFVEVRSILASQGYVKMRKLPECRWKVWTWAGTPTVPTTTTSEPSPQELYDLRVNELIRVATQELVPGDEFYEIARIMEGFDCSQRDAESVRLEIERRGYLQGDWADGYCRHTWSPTGN